MTSALTMVNGIECQALSLAGENYRARTSCIERAFRLAVLARVRDSFQIRGRWGAGLTCRSRYGDPALRHDTLPDAKPPPGDHIGAGQRPFPVDSRAPRSARSSPEHRLCDSCASYLESLIWNVRAGVSR